MTSKYHVDIIYFKIKSIKISTILYLCIPLSSSEVSLVRVKFYSPIDPSLSLIVEIIGIIVVFKDKPIIPNNIVLVVRAIK